MKTLTKSSRPGYTGGKSILKKVRSKTNQDVYYTYSNWETKEIEGVTFIPVVKENDSKKLQHTFWLRKDNVEYVK